MRVCKGLLLLALCLCCGSTALAEAYQAEDGRVKYDAAIDFPQGGEVPLLNAVSLSPQRKALISAVRLTEADAVGLIFGVVKARVQGVEGPFTVHKCNLLKCW